MQMSTNDRQTLARAQIVTEVLAGADIPTDGFTLDSEAETLTLTVPLTAVTLDPDADDNDIDPTKIGGGTIKRA